MMERPVESNVTKAHLAEVLGRLLDALDRQTFNGRPPGKYAYSMNVSDAMAHGRELLPEPKRDPPDPADGARSL